MKKNYRVKKNTDFNEIIKTGELYKNNYYIVYIKLNKLDKYRFGISASTKLGNAVCRNNLKRKMRHIIDKNKKNYQKGLDYIIIMRKPCVESNFLDLENKYIELIEKINKRRNNEK